MDPAQTVAPLPKPSPAAVLRSLPARQILALLVGVAALIAVAVGTVDWARTPEYRVLFANLSDHDGGAVVATLSQMNVPYRFSEGGSAILVPAPMVHEARLKLASQGLPKGGVVGFELMENQRFGTTQFQERVNFQRALEGELARSIQSLSAVQGARVHLALPAQNGFLREQQKPSASVLVQLYPGRTLDRAQIAGIVHLVAASVPDLDPKLVSVIDQTGTLLSGGTDGDAAGLDAAQLGYVHRLEAGYIRRITDILEPILGRENVRAQVTADVDFTRSESTDELYKPNQGSAPAAVRSQQTSESSDRAGAGAALGVPGALSNKPPVPTTAPINGPAQPPAAASAGNGASGGVTRREAVTNYEVDKTVRVTRNGAGAVRRLSVAVVVNNRKLVSADGKVSYAPLPPAEMQKIDALVREAIGFSKDRGDSVNVVNAPFSREEPPPPVDVPLWKQPETIDMARETARYLGLLALALVVVFAVVRPAMKQLAARAQSARAGRHVDATVENDLSLPAPASAPGLPGRAGSTDTVVQLARSNPATVANVVRNWVSSEV